MKNWLGGAPAADELTQHVTAINGAIRVTQSAVQAIDLQGLAVELAQNAAANVSLTSQRGPLHVRVLAKRRFNAPGK